LDEPHQLPPDARLLVTVLPTDTFEEERADWLRLSARGLAAAYGDDEPEYTDADIKTFTPDYNGR